MEKDKYAQALDAIKAIAFDTFTELDDIRSDLGGLRDELDILIEAIDNDISRRYGALGVDH